ncbi:hypothetical protein G6011_04077 [Alternaria panax]|uniref:Uncharacterized protein n=1 Tax=Alternaria panax TaxID=48097 RepID=A0AAD4IGC9_9PLEO|nr:hypothetical protein G6011_04077 [Alternaria panax]
MHVRYLRPGFQSKFHDKVEQYVSEQQQGLSNREAQMRYTIRLTNKLYCPKYPTIPVDGYECCERTFNTSSITDDSGECHLAVAYKEVGVDHMSWTRYAMGPTTSLE